MKKIYVLIMIIIAGFAIMSCDLLSTTAVNTLTNTEMTTETETEVISSTEATVSTVVSETTSNQTTTEMPSTTEQPTTIMTTTEQPTTIMTTTEQPTTTMTTTETVTEFFEPFRPTGYSLLQDEMEFIGIPSIGTAKVLVFAVDFSDYESSSTDVTVEDIEKVFNGTSEEISFESLSSFYDKSSFGKLNLTADVFGYYRAENTAQYYEDEYEKLWAVNPVTGEYIYDWDEVTYPDSDIIHEVLAYYDDQIDYTDYDSNNDGLIDGVYIVYSHPVSYSTSDSDLWWAYQTTYGYYNDYFDGVEPYFMCWSGSGFMRDDSDNLDARTIIHETGHMLGLDDYYDYSFEDNYNNGGLGGADMMDSATGDHGPFSKLLLGWTTPIVVEGTATVELLPYAETGEVILLIDKWEGTIFDEYMLFSFYTPTNLYEQDKAYYFNSDGVTLFHVSAQIDQGYNEDLYYYSIFNYNNTDTAYKVVKYVEADMNNHIERYDRIEYGDLLQTGDVFGDTIYSDYQWYSGEYFEYEVSIDSVMTDHTTIIITKK